MWAPTYIQAPPASFTLLLPISATMHTVYTQSLSHILQIVCGPIMQLLEEECQRNRRTVEKLKSERQYLQLQTVLSSQDSESEV